MPLRVGFVLFRSSQAPLRFDEWRCTPWLALVMDAAGEGKEEDANATDSAEAGVSRPWQREAGQRDGARVHCGVVSEERLLSKPLLAGYERR